MPQEDTAAQSPTFDEFPKPTPESWRAVAEKSLKGADFERKLVTRTYEGIDLQPLYFEAQAAEIAARHSLPGAMPFTRGATPAGDLAAPWQIAQAIPYATPEAFNAALRDDLARGQTTVNLPLDRATRLGLDADAEEGVAVGGVSISALVDLALALEGISLAQTPVFIDAGTAGAASASLLAALAGMQGVSAANLTGWVAHDPLGVLAETGKLPGGVDAAYDEMASLTGWAIDNAPKLDTVAVSSAIYHDGGAHAVQELAYALATGVAYLRAMIARGLDATAAAARMRFRFAIGGKFFMEIAKFRAVRSLWAQILRAFAVDPEAAPLRAHAQTGHFNKTVTDPYVNMLRTTTEALAGAIGGVQSLHVDPFDAIIRPPDDFSRRIARNQQIILQEEVNLTRLIDPAGGSWYIEWLTDQIAERAWAAFQTIEAAGGIVEALKKGTPQAEVAQVAVERAHNLGRRKDKLVGTNMYANLGETPVRGAVDTAAVAQERASLVQASREPQRGAIRTLAEAISAASLGATVSQISAAFRGKGEDLSVTPICVHRIAEPFERLRAAADAHAERTGGLPRIFLATMGPLRQHKARADFSQGFFNVGGFEAVYPDGFDTPQAAAEAALAAGAGAVVICSTDEDYVETVPPLARAIKAARPEMPIILAGHPGEQVTTYREAGVDEFIHLKADCYAVNAWLHEKLGLAPASS